jgi:MurNAc alpha-1-phosphate uridylyltransferase
MGRHPAEPMLPLLGGGRRVRVPRQAMVLAAGFGQRLRPLTDTVPKPLVRVAGVPIIDTVLDRLADAGIEEAVVNLHHLGHLIEAHLAGRTRPAIRFSRESQILETGGGIRQALPLLGDEPFFVVNGKIVWLNGKVDALLRMAEAWDAERMDALLLLHPTVSAVGYGGLGDFQLDQEGRVRRRRGWEVVPFIYSGIQIVHPRIFAAAPDGHFSMNLLFDRAIESGRLFGLRHDGEWYDVSTPTQLAETEARLAGGGTDYYGL